MKHIESPKNPDIKALLRLKERRIREKEQRFLLEGAREIVRALSMKVELETLYICPDLFKPESQAALDESQYSDVVMVSLSKAAFEKLSYRDNPDGLLALANMQKTDLDSLQLSKHALVLILDSLEKPGNLGALLRTADAANLDAVFVTGSGTDLYNPNVIRASMGSLFSRPVLPVEQETLKTWLQTMQFSIVAATPDATNSYWQTDFRVATAIVLGTEHEGLSDFWMQACNVQVVIPMNGLADSLNVAASGALLVYEALRQRRG